MSDAASIARTHRERARGLLARAPLSGNEAMLFEKTKQVHTFGMAYALDVIFCDADFRVLRVSRNVVPRRVTAWVFGARYTIEMRAGAVPESVDRGTQLALSNNETGAVDLRE